MKRDNRLPPFYALDDNLPLLLGVTSGLQHALAMLAGLITPPIIFASSLSLDAEISSYMISASLIGCGEYYCLSTRTSWELMGGNRYPQSCANVSVPSFQKLLSRHWSPDSCWNQLCDTKHSERGMFSPGSSARLSGLIINRFSLRCIKMEHVPPQSALMELQSEGPVPMLMGRSWEPRSSARSSRSSCPSARPGSSNVSSLPLSQVREASHSELHGHSD